MKRVVLHPSAFADWLTGDRTDSLRLEFEAGRLDVIVPHSFAVDMTGELAARRWSKDGLTRAAVEVEQIGFRNLEPPASEIADWLLRGPSASAATYAAPASWLDGPIAVTDPALASSLRTLPRAV